MIWQSSKNYSKSLTLDTKSRQQCRVRDQECIIIVSPIYMAISLWFETSALQRYKYDKHTYPLRFVTSWSWQTVSFPVYFQRRFRQDPHQNLEKNSNCQVLAINAYVLIVSMYHNLCYLCPLIEQAVLKPLKRYSIHRMQIGHFRNVRGLGKSMVVFRLFEKLKYSNERSTIF